MLRPASRMVVLNIERQALRPASSIWHEAPTSKDGGMDGWSGAVARIKMGLAQLSGVKCDFPGKQV